MKNLLTTGSVGAKIAIVLTATVGGVALVGSSVFASLTATASNSPTHSVTSGTLKLLQAGSSSGLTAGFTSAVTGLAPGDTINRFIDVTNTGTLAGAFGSMTLGLLDTVATPTLLTTSATQGLTVTVAECAAGYTAGGTCAATETTVLASTAASAIISSAKPLTLILADFAASTGVAHLHLTITLPSATNNETTANGLITAPTIQGQVANLTWTFTEAQRAGSNTQA